MEPTEEEDIPENEKLKIEKNEPRRITMQLITRTSLDNEMVSSLSEEDKYDISESESSSYLLSSLFTLSL